MKEWNSLIDLSFPYLTGNGFSTHCRYIYNYDGYKQNPRSQNLNWYYVKIDWINDFFNKYQPKEQFVLFTGNSDFPITSAYQQYLDIPNLKYWFGANVDYDHPKLKAIPLGIANAGYTHADIKTLNQVRTNSDSGIVARDNMFYANFTITNNRHEREYCLEQCGVKLITGEGWDCAAGRVQRNYFDYLTDLSKSYFCISPKGNGIDCHRTWESLYVGCIPIVTKSIIAEQHKDYPIMILNDWSEFKNINFSPELYTKIWNNWNIGEIHMDNYLKRINKIIMA